MRNKKFVKTATLLSSLMGLALVSSSLSSSIISSKQNDTTKSDINNEAKASSYKNTVPANDQTISASSVFDPSTVSGDIFVEISGTSLSITGYDTNFSANNPSVLSSITIEETTIEKVIFYQKCFASCTTIEGEFTCSNLVSEINYGAFQSCTNLTSVNFQYSTQLTSIGIEAFTGCKNITSVDFGAYISTIGMYAFYGCEKLSSVSIPASVTSIGDSAFAYCYSLSNIDLSNATNLSSIGVWAFQYCSIKKINPVKNNSSFSLVSNTNSEGLATAWLLVSGNVETPWDGNAKPVGCLAYGAVDYTTLTNITIQENAFEFCAGITSVDFGTNVTSIGYEAFYNCANLSTVTIGSNIESFGNSTFGSCSSLTNVDLSNATNLSSIGEYAFSHCPLTSIHIPSNVSSIGTQAFEYCPITEITVADGNKTYEIAKNNNGKATLVVGKTTSSNGEWDGSAPVGCLAYGDISYANLGPIDITDNAFAHCTNIKTVDFGSNVLSIGVNAFQYCNSITSINLSNATKLSSIGANAFEDCASLTSLDLTNTTNLSSIGEYSFMHCENLNSIIFGSSAALIGNYAFGACINLTSVYFGDNAPTSDSTEYFPFEDCISLTSVYVPEDKLFDASYLTASNCSSLGLDINTNHIVAESNLHNYVSNPGSVSGAAELRRTGFSSESTPHFVALNDIGNISLSGDTTLYLSYQSSDTNSITRITTNAFANSDASIETVKLGTQITTIQANAFSDANIKSIDLTDWTAAEFEQLVNSEDISISWLGNLKSENLTITVNENQLGPFNQIAAEIGIDGCTIVGKASDNSNLALGLGLGLGLGIPAVAGAIGGTVYGVKKHKIKKQ